jgi:hypothetical protein
MDDELPQMTPGLGYVSGVLAFVGPPSGFTLRDLSDSVTVTMDGMLDHACLLHPASFSGCS